LPKENKALKPCVFYFNKCFVNAHLVVDARGNLAQMSSQIKMKEEDSMEKFNPWNRKVQLLERMLESQNSMQKLDVAEGDILKHIQEVWVEAMSTVVHRAVTMEISTMIARARIMSTIIARVKVEEEEQQIKELVENNSNLKQCERGRTKWQSMDQSKNMLETKIEEMWQLMIKHSIWRKMVASIRKINQNLNLIDKKKRMEKKTTKVHQQQRRKALDSYKTKYGIQEDKDQKTHDQEIMDIFYFRSLMQKHSTQEKIIVIK